MTIKREAISFSSDFNESPTKKVKSESKPDAQERWSDDQIKLLCSLKVKGISWEYALLCAFLTCRDIGSYFPGRTKNALIKIWQRRGREAQEVFTPEIVPPSMELGWLVGRAFEIWVGELSEEDVDSYWEPDWNECKWMQKTCNGNELFQEDLR